MGQFVETGRVYEWTARAGSTYRVDVRPGVRPFATWIGLQGPKYLGAYLSLEEAFAACLAHDHVRGIGPRDVDADGRPVEAV